MAATVRFATGGDTAAIAALLDGIERHYGQPPLPRETVTGRVSDWLSDEAGASRFVLALERATPVGLASVAVLRPGPALGGGLFVKDIYVSYTARSGGIGTAIMRFLARHCVENGIARLDLTTERWNEGALRFYDRLGGERQDDKVFLRFPAGALEKMAKE